MSSIKYALIRVAGASKNEYVRVENIKNLPHKIEEFNPKATCEVKLDNRTSYCKALIVRIGASKAAIEAEISKLEANGKRLRFPSTRVTKSITPPSKRKTRESSKSEKVLAANSVDKETFSSSRQFFGAAANSLPGSSTGRETSKTKIAEDDAEIQDGEEGYEAESDNENEDDGEKSQSLTSCDSSSESWTPPSQHQTPLHSGFNFPHRSLSFTHDATTSSNRSSYTGSSDDSDYENWGKRYSAFLDNQARKRRNRLQLQINNEDSSEDDLIEKRKVSRPVDPNRKGCRSDLNIERAFGKDRSTNNNRFNSFELAAGVSGKKGSARQDKGLLRTVSEPTAHLQKNHINNSYIGQLPNFEFVTEHGENLANPSQSEDPLETINDEPTPHIVEGHGNASDREVAHQHIDPIVIIVQPQEPNNNQDTVELQGPNHNQDGVEPQGQNKNQDGGEPQALDDDNHNRHHHLENQDDNGRALENAGAAEENGRDVYEFAEDNDNELPARRGNPRQVPQDPHGDREHPEIYHTDGHNTYLGDGFYVGAWTWRRIKTLNDSRFIKTLARSCIGDDVLINRGFLSRRFQFGWRHLPERREFTDAERNFFRRVLSDHLREKDVEGDRLEFRLKRISHYLSEYISDLHKQRRARRVRINN